jgi:hypothetical protein
MPFCRVYKNAVGEDFFSFEGYFVNKDKTVGEYFANKDITIYAAVMPTDPEFEDCHSSFEAVDVRGGRALYEMSDYLSIGGREHYDIAVYKLTDRAQMRNLYGLYGYVETKSGKIITPAQYSDVQPFLNQKFAKACFPDGHIEFIDTTG